MHDADVLVVGGGIAGLCAAYFASRAGRAVTVVDEGLHRASDLPIALINPLRGHTGRLVTDGVDGMHATFALIDTLRDAGHAIDGGRGLFRPLIGVPPRAAQRTYWTERLVDRLAFDWHDAAPSSLGLADPVPAMFLPEAGWVASGGLLTALRVESRATIVVSRATAIAADPQGGGTVTLVDGSALVARTILWCGGAWGGALLDRASSALDDATYKPGSLLRVATPLTRVPLAFGLYAVPWRDVTIVGPTREGSCSTFPEEAVADEVVAHLADRVARVFDESAPALATWRGVRLTRLSSAASTSLSGIATLTALGSRGFLMAPMLAATWARSL
jgi:glycine/D-amino acid oxidase-like deaminating enzyme